MVSRVFSAGLLGIDGYVVTVECFLSGGLPRLDVVGLPTGAVAEAGDRVRAAAKACGFDWPVSRLTVNLAPADTKKAGTAYDLPILLSILAAAGEINAPPQDAVFLGELSLTGALRPVCGALSMALAARDAGFKTIYVPAQNAAEAAYADGMTILPVPDLGALVNHLHGRGALTPCPPPTPPAPRDETLDFCHVMGQHAVKRALEIAAAGGHNILLSGSPGSGKSMMAKRFSSILPPLSTDERLEVIRVWSAVGRGQQAVERAERPFRAPHHTSSANAMAGGSGAAGRLPMPGEITLAHRGVLFLDELPEFHRDVLETLRQPLEDGCVTISRVAGQVTYPAQFQLIAAMNPCKCGWYGTDRCTCSTSSVRQYLKRLSGPLLDRIDLQVTVQPVEYAALAARGTANEESSADIRARVLAARTVQYARQGKDTCNASIAPAQLAAHCPLSEDASHMFAAAFERLGLTARAHDRVLRVARTIADLANSSTIEAVHLAEALQYRTLDRTSAE
ncbi:MAG: YifB family Mg chelatase-like AAA ATPase [Agathobaculum sp.]|uniref:YifB family Mg chelatase-like AAA ATPase n=1 Tax=Agathobaculum sp. TaxID=2048138 RepID=UPI0025B88CD9|nr:YifB family Mg chelatase-like AAA ATPase [Agathobaculum sp.]MCI7124781.1 YifB family Mg chelatase-like AAA ATPase [Agathobaculum sp.]MDY3711648.1 YifB family Mg chelatase-like AAA ATPase [Agathobaculum sp.]